MGLAIGGCANQPGSHSGSARADQGTLSTDRPHASTAPATRPAEVVARVEGDVITLDQLRKPLFKAYGLNVLLHLVQLDLAQRQAAKAGLAITDQDVAQERSWTVAQMFQGADDKLKTDLDDAVAKKDTKRADELRQAISDQNKRLLDQFLAQQHISEPEFDLVMRANAYLRKVATSQMPTITEENLKEAWKAQYGEKVVIRHIQLANLQEVAQAKAKLKAGEPFEQVARQMSRNERTRALGGELPPFSRNATDIPEEFKRVAFDLKVGEVSDPVLAEGSYHLLKLERRIAPKAVKFEDVKQAVRKTLIERWTAARINQLRQQLAQAALHSMKIEDPILREQFQQRLDAQNAVIKDKDAIRRELLEKKTEAPAATQPATQAATAPATRP
jgi:foldase protein PrsA